MAVHFNPEPQNLAPDQLRVQIRTRLVNSNFANWERNLTYARPFAPGVVQVLCLDYPDAICTLGDKILPALALPLEELWKHGQQNTDAQPVDEIYDIDEYAHCMYGNPVFLASRAGNFASLVSEVIGPAPMGVAFGIPDQTMLIYSVISIPEAFAQLMDVTRNIDVILCAPDMEHPGGVISPDLYYWAPDGTVERIGVSGDDGMDITPTPSFTHYVPWKQQSDHDPHEQAHIANVD